MCGFFFSELIRERASHCSHYLPCKADEKHQSLGRHLPELLHPDGLCPSLGDKPLLDVEQLRGPEKWEAENEVELRDQ